MLSLTHYPLLALDRWREIIGWNPWHFWGLLDTQKAPVTSACNTLLYQHTWQAVDRMGRNDILEGIAQAEQRLFDKLYYHPAPKYTVKTFDYPVNPIPLVSNLGYMGSDGRWAALDIRERFIQAVGVETSTLIEDESSVTYSDLDGDGLNELFTLTVTTPAGLTDLSQVKVYFNATDRYAGEDIGPRWEIKPLSIAVNGPNLVIRGAAWLLVKPIKYEPTRPVDLHISETDNFATSLDVYRVYIDPTGTTVDTAQAKFIWETQPHSHFALCCDPVNNSTDPAAVATATGRAGIRDSRLGELAPAQAVYNATTQTWCAPDWPFTCRPPDRVTVRYQAGYPLENGRMALSMEKAVAYLAAAEMPRPLCACDAANRALYHWQFDLARTDGRNGEAYGAISAGDLDNPFGTRRGHVYAWREIKDLRVLVGFSPSSW